MQSEAPAASSVIQSEAHSATITPAVPLDIDHAKPRPLWHVALIIMAIVFGPALVAWVVTLSH